MDKRYGARDLRRKVERLVEEPLARIVFGGKLGDYSVCRVFISGNELIIEPSDEADK